jgi:predicted DNA-binding transcriptional regulator AlpA
MRRILRDLAGARKELLDVQREFVQLQKRIDAVRDCVTDSLTRIFGEERPALVGLAEEEFMEKLAGRVASRLGAQTTSKMPIANRYVREKEAAAFLGMSVSTLQGWRSRGTGGGPPWTKVGGMVMYSMKELEEYMELRTIARR